MIIENKKMFRGQLLRVLEDEKSVHQLLCFRAEYCTKYCVSYIDCFHLIIFY